MQIANLSNDALTQLLLYGDKDLSYEVNRDILRLTLRFIRETGWFDLDLLKLQLYTKQPPSIFT